LYAATLGATSVVWIAREIADYCESDVINTYRVWLRYELFRGRLRDAAFQASEANLLEYIRAHANAKPHLIDLTK
jgi:hypothetical protein